MSVISPLKHFGWRNQANTKPSPSTQYFDEAFAYIQRGFKPISNRHTSRDWSWTKHKTSFGYSSRWQTSIKYSNSESPKHATLGHVVGHVLESLRQGLPTQSLSTEK